MKKELNLNHLVSKSKLYVKRSTPTILTVACSIGTVVSVVMAVKATPKALKIIEEASEEKKRPLTKFEIINVAGPSYIPTAIVGISTIAGMVCLNIINKKQQASLIGGYGLLRNSYQRYKKSAIEVYGDDADSNITKHTARDMYLSADGECLYNPDTDNPVEKALFFDEYSERYFTSTLTAVTNAQYHINRNLALKGYVSINEFYEFLGLDIIESGYDYGWCMYDMAEDGLMWLDFKNTLTQIEEEEAGLECYVISSSLMPDFITYE